MSATMIWLQSRFTPPGDPAFRRSALALPRLRGMEALAGHAWGLAAALCWGAYLAFARSGAVAGLAPLDFSVLRLGVAGLLLLPALLRNAPRTLGGIGWRRGLVLTVFAGPAFILASTLGAHYAPLAHGAVMQPAGLVIGAMVLAVLVLGEQVAALRWLGVGVVLAGLAVVSGAGFEGAAWRGDLLFVAAGLLWAGFTVAGRAWRVDPLQATAVVSVLGGLASLGLWLGFGDPAAMLAHGPRVLLVQALVQGALTGVGAVYAFARAVKALGAARAAVYPAMVPAIAVLAGIPVAGEWPTPQQALGLGIVLAGLPLAMGIVAARR